MFAIRTSCFRVNANTDRVYTWEHQELDREFKGARQQRIVSWPVGSMKPEIV